MAGGASACARGCATGRVGLSGQMHGLVVLDADDRVLRPAILWNDQRTGAECAEIEERVGLERLIALTGQPRADRLHRAEAAVAAHATSPRSTRASATSCCPKDYVRLRLTGERAIDVADASGTLLFDVAPAPVERRGLRRARDPARVAAAGARVDGDRAARATRRPARSGSASIGPGPLSVVLGTSGVVFAALPRLPRRPRGARARLLPRRARHLARDGRDALRGRARCAGCATSSARTFDELVARGRSAGRPAPRACCSRRTSPGERTPHADPDARGAFAGLSLRHDRGALVRAVLEGVAYGLRDSLELLRELGVRARRSAASRAAARAASCG